MSPTPIREALRLLQAEGLIANEPHHGMVVRTYAVEEADEVYAVRVLVEPLATGKAALRATPIQLRELQKLHRRFVAAARSDHPNTATLNASWHRALYDAAGSPVLLEVIMRLWRSLPARAMWSSSRRDGSIQDHKAIMHALETRDRPRAESLMRDHLESGWAANTERLRQAAAQAETQRRRTTSRTG